MFTGLIEERGRLLSLRRGAKESELTIECQKVLAGTKIGDSIAVNGICLTVTKLGNRSFSAFAMAQTMKTTSLGDLSQGSLVNLERALKLGDRLGGHLVSGHIDGTGVIADIKEDGEALWFHIQAPREILRYVILRGSIAIAGISLTVAKLCQKGFWVSIIPHTMAETILPTLKIGQRVNLEVDALGKYAERFFLLQNQEAQGGQSLGSESGEENSRQTKQDGIDLDFLGKYGFL